ncbi:MAG: FAD-dependent thymidylate synthase [Planctomycetota bacterium]
MSEELHVNPEFPEELPYRRVLDHGFVALVDVMGSDASIVQAARVSYGKGTKTVRSDKALISYLMRHHHTTPFEMCEFKFLMRLPVFIARQVIRHRTASVNEYSGRYSIVPDRFWVPSLGAISEQDKVNRQGRADLLRELAEALPERAESCRYCPDQKAVLVAPDGSGLSRRALARAEHRAAFAPLWSEGTQADDLLPTESYVYWVEQLLKFFPERKARLEKIQATCRENNERCYGLYRTLMEQGVAREIARSVLPLSMYTEWYWKMDLHNLFHFLRLRMDPHAQLEVRAFAEAMATFVRPHVPFAWEAFEESRLQGVFLSANEKDVLRPVDDAMRREILTALHERGYRQRRLKEVCRKLAIDEGLVDELWPARPRT